MKQQRSTREICVLCGKTLSIYNKTEMCWNHSDEATLEGTNSEEIIYSVPVFRELEEDYAD